MGTPSIMINVEGCQHKLKLGKSIVLGYENDEFDVVIPITCVKCNKKIIHDDILESFDMIEKEDGIDTLMHNPSNEFNCPNCNSLITLEVDISLYLNNFEFYTYNIENCVFSHVFELGKLDDYIPSRTQH